MNLFAYGTLMEPRLLGRIIGSSPAAETATLHGYQRFAFQRESYPGMVPAKKSESVTGKLFFNLDDLAWQYLDGFEGNFYTRITVQVITEANINYPAETYIVRDNYRQLLAETDWDFAKFLRHDLSAYLAEK